jgi:hypothetical protein
MGEKDASLKNTMFFDVSPFSPLQVHLRFHGHYYLHLQGRSVSQATDQQEAGSK